MPKCLEEYIDAHAIDVDDPDYVRWCDEGERNYHEDTLLYEH